MCLIKEHGSWWAKFRKKVNEFDVKSFWRVTFDNLDFRMRFATKISAGGGQLKRMLHLLTSQVSFRQISPRKATNNSSSTPPSIAANRTPPTEDTIRYHLHVQLDLILAVQVLVHEKSQKINLGSNMKIWNGLNIVYTLSSINVTDDVSFDNSKEPPLLDKLQNYAILDSYST